MYRSRRSSIALLLLLFGVWASAVGAQEEVDLEFQTAVTPEYETYLDEKEEELATRIDEATDEDRARLILVKIAQLHVDLDRADRRISAANEDIEFQLDGLEEVIRDELKEEDAESVESFLRAVRQRFVEERDAEVEERLEEIFDSIEADNEEIDAALEELGEALAENTDEVLARLDELREGEEPFVVKFHLSGGGFDAGDVFEVSRENIDDIEAVEEALKEAGDQLVEARDLLDSAEEENDNKAAIATMRTALAQLDIALEIVQEALDKQPLSTFGQELALIDQTGSAVEELRGWVSEVDEILGGRTFTVGDMVIRPIALIENRTARASVSDDFAEGAILFSLLARRQFAKADARDEERAEKARLVGWIWVVLAGGIAGVTDPPEDLFREFYSAAVPERHTFRGLFPEGLSPAMLEIIGADMIVNANVSRAVMDRHMEALREGFQARVEEEPLDAEANAGLAVISTYFLVADNHSDVEEVIELAAAGDIVGIVERFDVEDFDYSESLDSIRADIENARLDPDMVFLVLDKLEDDPEAPFAIGEDDEFVPIPLTGKLLGQSLDVVEDLAATGIALAETAVALLEEAEESFELDLDPNLLDFSDAESGLDFAVALERSNARFLHITPAGRENLQEAGDQLEEELVEFSGAVAEMKNLLVSLDEQQDVELEVGGLASSMEDFDAFYQDVRQDFESEEETTEIGGRNVNMSAWFDSPPDSLLQRFIWYLDDNNSTNNTLGGLFPEEVGSVVLEEHTPALPSSFALEQNFPNPFNSATAIRFALPAAAQVRLEIYDLAGQQVETLVEGIRQAGVHTVIWNGRKGNGGELASGVYLYRLRAGQEAEARKLILLR